ncbi:DUF3667 domain-containing protein [Paracoccus sp. M683]|uniref:DUF3667 domain-containing protein n=1 Tax=Paracoccus sp. M683 TaxID=2594268 RepID=UPI00117E0FFB|nr:DUF3667 domain-containing protein [Paracoccus sp. M683]TRW98365.1 DUF3667 domain-containing protein [Paracoccus sp. M683]
MALLDTVLGRDAPCRHRRIGKYCPDCGMLQELPRYSFGEMTKGPAVFWMEKGFRRTLVGLFHHPGRAIRTFLFEDRNHLIKPMAYLLLAIAFNLGVQGLLSEPAACAADDGLCLMFKEDPVTPKLVEIGIFALIYRLAFRR